MCVWNFKQLALRCGIKCFVLQSEQFSETVCAFSCCKKVNLCCSICHNSCGEDIFIISSMSTREVCNTCMTNPENTQDFLAYRLCWPKCSSFSTISHSYQRLHRLMVYILQKFVFLNLYRECRKRYITFLSSKIETIKRKQIKTEILISVLAQKFRHRS
jgi:hypothetical protein